MDAFKSQEDPHLCISCRQVEVGSRPPHVVHPKHGAPLVFDVYGMAICPTCGARWQSRGDNLYEIVETVATPFRLAQRRLLFGLFGKSRQAPARSK